VRCDRGVPAPEELSRDELIALVGTQAQRIAAQDGQITRMAGELAALTEANEALAGKLARLEHLLPRNSENSSSPTVERRSAGPEAAGRQGPSWWWAETGACQVCCVSSSDFLGQWSRVMPISA